MNSGAMPPGETNRKSGRIASNTMLLFARMLVVTIINLYAVRLVLAGLGKVDYGIFNAVAGVVTSTAFISGVLALSVQRFYSYALGKGDSTSSADIFSVSCNMIIVLSAVILVVFETVGLWFVCNYLTIPPERMHATLLLYQFSLFSFITSLASIPYTAAVFAHEDMGIYAAISTADCALKMILAFLLGHCLIDHLEFYGGGLLAISIAVLASYAIISRSRYSECRYGKVKDKKLYKKMTSFGGWTMLGSLSSTGMMQGNTILINVFFGPVANAAFAISQQINVAFNSLCSNAVIPLRPAMIKAYSAGEYSYLDHLFAAANKFLLYTLVAVALPLIAEMPFVLRVWLGHADAETVLFCRLIIIFTVFLAMHNPITIIIHASGHVREYHLPVESITLLCLPITWALYMAGMPVESVFGAMIGVCVAAHIVRLVCLKRFYSQFSITHYVKGLLIPGIIVSTIATVAAMLIHSYIAGQAAAFVATFVAVPLVIIAMAYSIGFNDQERKEIKALACKYIRRKV